MSRVQLALRVADLEGSIAFYAKLFGAEPAKRRPGYANFAIAEPPLKLVLIEGSPASPPGWTTSASKSRPPPRSPPPPPAWPPRAWPPPTEENTACCYAVQDKVWVTGPGNEPWEVYVVKGDADTLDKTADSVCCSPDADADGTVQPAAACC